MTLTVPRTVTTTISLNPLVKAFDRFLGGIAPPTCVSCGTRPAAISRRFEDVEGLSEVFEVCWDCR